MNTRQSKHSSSLAALSLLGLAILLSLTTGSEPAGAEIRLDSNKPFLVTIYRSCATLEPTGLQRFDFCYASAEYVGTGARTECFTESYLGDCL